MMDPDPEYRIPAAAREELEKIIKEDLEYATVSSASVRVDDVGRIIVEELVLRLPDGRMVSASPFSASPGYAGDMRLDVYDDHLAGGHGWREVTIAEDYAELLDVLPDRPVCVGEGCGAREHLVGDPFAELRRVHERRERVCVLQALS